MVIKQQADVVLTRTEKHFFFKFVKPHHRSKECYDHEIWYLSSILIKSFVNNGT